MACAFSTPSAACAKQVRRCDRLRGVWICVAALTRHAQACAAAGCAPERVGSVDVLCALCAAHPDVRFSWVLGAYCALLAVVAAPDIGPQVRTRLQTYAPDAGSEAPSSCSVFTCSSPSARASLYP